MLCWPDDYIQFCDCNIHHRCESLGIKIYSGILRNFRYRSWQHWALSWLHGWRRCWPDWVVHTEREIDRLDKHSKRCEYDKYCKHPKYCKIWQNHLHHLDTQFVAGIVDQYLFSFQTCVAISSFTIALPVSFLLDCDPAPLASCLK